MELIRITQENLEREHICCAISNNNDCQVFSKKAWLRERLEEGLVFLKGNVRGKCFIEYIPAEYAWAPIEAEGYMMIHCLWVSGQFKGHGYSRLLLDACVQDSREKGKRGLAILSSKKKMGYLSDPKFMRYQGFEAADTANPYFELLYLPFDKGAPKPRFKASVKEPGQGGMAEGFTVYYTSQCPFTAKYVPILGELAKERNAPFQAVHITAREQAQSALCPLPPSACFITASLSPTRYSPGKGLKSSWPKRASDRLPGRPGFVPGGQGKGR